MRQALNAVFYAAAVLLLAACSGGGGGGIVDPPDPDPSYSAAFTVSTMKCVLLSDRCVPPISVDNADSVQVTLASGASFTSAMNVLNGVSDALVRTSATTWDYIPGSVMSRDSSQHLHIRAGKFFKGSMHWKDGNDLVVQVETAKPDYTFTVENGECVSATEKGLGRYMILKTNVPGLLPAAGKFEGTLTYQENSVANGLASFRFYHSPTEAVYVDGAINDHDLNVYLVNPTPGGGVSTSHAVAHVKACP
jgi:hypothetical protein